MLKNHLEINKEHLNETRDDSNKNSYLKPRTMFSTCFGDAAIGFLNIRNLDAIIPNAFSMHLLALDNL